MGAETRFVDITYRGLKVAAKAKLVESSDSDSAGFVEVDAPLPVGTRVTLVDNGQTIAAKVTGVVEQEAGAKSAPGMRIAWGAAAEKPAEKPAPAVLAAPAAPAVPAPAAAAAAASVEPSSEVLSSTDLVTSASTEVLSSTDLVASESGLAPETAEPEPAAVADSVNENENESSNVTASAQPEGRRRRKTKKTQIGRP